MASAARFACRRDCIYEHAYTIRPISAQRGNCVVMNRGNVCKEQISCVVCQPSFWFVHYIPILLSRGYDMDSNLECLSRCSEGQFIAPSSWRCHLSHVLFP